MIEKKNFTDNDDVTIIAERGIFKVIEYRRDLSVEEEHSDTAFFCNAMNVRKRQVVCEGQNTNIIVQSGAMQWTAGNVKTETGIKGIGDIIGKTVQGAVTGESGIKPEYSGGGTIVLEPTYRHSYPDFTFDGDDIIILSRTAANTPNSQHDNNMIAFFRVENYKQYRI